MSDVATSIQAMYHLELLSRLRSEGAFDVSQGRIATLIAAVTCGLIWMADLAQAKESDGCLVGITEAVHQTPKIQDLDSLIREARNAAAHPNSKLHMISQEVMPDIKMTSKNTWNFSASDDDVMLFIGDIRILLNGNFFRAQEELFKRYSRFC